MMMAANKLRYAKKKEVKKDVDIKAPKKLKEKVVKENE